MVYNNLPVGVLIFDTSVITDEITVVSECGLYEPFGSFEHNVNAK